MMKMITMVAMVVLLLSGGAMAGTADFECREQTSDRVYFDNEKLTCGMGIIDTENVCYGTETTNFTLYALTAKTLMTERVKKVIQKHHGLLIVSFSCLDENGDVVYGINCSRKEMPEFTCK